MIGILSILGTIVVVPLILTTTFLSILVFTLLNQYVVPINWHPATNIAMVLISCLSVIVAAYIYTISIYQNPIIKAILARSRADNVAPSTIISDMKRRVVIATFIVTCWHRYSGPKIITYISTQTYEIPHVDETPSLNDDIYSQSSLMQIHLKPDIIISEDSKKYLAKLEQDLYEQHRHKGQYCSISYKLEIPGIPHTATLITGKKHPIMGRRVMILFVSTVFLVPLYLLICSLKTKIVTHKITKKLIPAYLHEENATLPSPNYAKPSAPLISHKDELKLIVPGEKDDLMLE